MTEPRFEEGERVRVDIPDESDPDHDRLHGKLSVIVDVLSDDAGEVSGNSRDDLLYRIELDDGGETDVQWRNIRPP